MQILGLRVMLAQLNSYRLGVPEVVIQRILRHSNVQTTTAYYIKTSSDDVRRAMSAFEKNIAEVPAVCAEVRQKLIRQATHGW
jgi:integrase